MTHDTKSRNNLLLLVVLFVLVFTSVQSAHSQSPQPYPDLDEAVLASDWQTIYYLTTQIADSLQTPVIRTLAYNACLALDCNEMLDPTQLQLSESWQVLDWAAALSEKNPNSAVAFYFWGVASQQVREHERAILKFKKALELDSSFFLAHVLLGLTYYSQGNLDAAANEYTQAIAIQPNNTKAYTSRGGIYDYQRQPSLAVRDYEAALKINPNDPMTYYNRANAYRHLGELKLAIKDYSRVIDLEPEFAAAYHNRANSYSDLKKYDNAVSDYQRFIFLAPAEMGQLVSQARATAQSIKSVKFFRDNPKAAERYNQGILAAQKGDFKTAIEHLDAATELKNDFALIYQTRGYVYTETGGWDAREKGIADFSRAIELDPDDYMNYLYRAELYNRQNLSDSAVMDCDKALLISPNNLEIMFSRGFSHIVAGDSEGAIKDFTNILNLNPEDAASYRMRGDSYEALGDTAKALADYKSFMTFSPPEETRIKKSIRKKIRELIAEKNN